MDYKVDDFRAQIIKSLKIMSERDGPYLIHYIEGKDRTGFLCALLECLSGASYDEIAADYMESYKNLYGIDRASDPEKYDMILGNNLVPMLRFMTGADENADITTVDRGSGVEAYLLGGGMTEEEIGALKEKISGGQVMKNFLSHYQLPFSLRHCSSKSPFYHAIKISNYISSSLNKSSSVTCF